jgi:LysR family transcriptional regulator, regulator for bpeEF and oprC
VGAVCLLFLFEIKVMDKLAAMRMFVRVVESGSFSQATRDLKVSQPTVSKQLAARLGDTTPRKKFPYPFCDTRKTGLLRGNGAHSSGFRLRRKKIVDGQSTPSGLVLATLSLALGRMFVIPRLLDFRDRFPNVSIERTDVAIRIGRLSDSALEPRFSTTSSMRITLPKT